MSEAPSEEPAEQAPAKLCRCGHARGNPMVSAQGEFTFGASVLTLIGISARPYAVRFVCRRCEETIERSTDPEVLKATRLWG